MQLARDTAESLCASLSAKLLVAGAVCAVASDLRQPKTPTGAGAGLSIAQPVISLEQHVLQLAESLQAQTLRRQEVEEISVHSRARAAAAEAELQQLKSGRLAMKLRQVQDEVASQI